MHTAISSRIWFVFIGVASGLLVSCAGDGQVRPSATSGNDATEIEPVEVVGVWEGALSVSGTDLSITVRFLTDPSVGDETGNRSDGSPPTATMDIPAQMAFGLALSEVRAHGKFPGDAVHFELATGGPRFIADGTLAAGDDGRPVIEGRFVQGAASGAFSLTRIGDIGQQAPQAAVPSPDAMMGGTEADVSVERGGTVLRGTLRAPEGDGPWPLAIIVAGSGPTDRDGNNPLIPGHNDSLKELASALAGSGIATVRYDKRGVGASAAGGIREEDLSFADYVNDLLAWVSWADLRQDVSSVAIIGHSEGGLIALAALGADAGTGSATGIEPSAAARARELVDALVCVAAPGRPLDVIVLEQLERSLGTDSPLLARAREIVEAIRTGQTVSDVPADLMTLFRPSVQPYLRSEFQFDPAALAASTRQRMLVIAGTEDLQIPATDAEMIAQARPGARLVVVSGMNHVLKEVPAGDTAANQNAYTDPSVPLSVEFVEAVSSFLLGT